MSKFILLLHVLFPVAALSSALILRTADGGISWEREESGSVYSLNAVSVDIASGYAVAAGDMGTLLRRGNNGIWVDVSPVGLESNLQSVAVGTDGLAMVCGDSGTLLSSFDGGLSWRVWNEFDAGGEDLLSVNFDPSHSGAFVITGENGFVYTSEAGRIETVNDSSFIGSCAILCSSFPEIAVSSSGDVYSFSQKSSISSGGDYSLNGVTPVVSGGSPFAAVGDSGSVFIFSSNSFLRQESNSIEDLSSVAALVYGGPLCAVGKRGTILLSTEGYGGWLRVSSETLRDLNGVAGNGSGVGYIVGENLLPELISP